MNADSSLRLAPPSFEHWFGTDVFGRDYLNRCLEGLWLSVRVSLTATLVTLLLGTGIGILCAHGPKPFRMILNRALDLALLFPTVLLAILLSSWLGQGIHTIWISLALASWAPHARLVRAKTLELNHQLFVKASYCLGATPVWIWRRHLAPHLTILLWVSLRIQAPHQILVESFLSFVGVGVQPPEISLGVLAADGFSRMQSDPHLLFFPSAILSLLTFILFRAGGRPDPARSGLPIKITKAIRQRKHQYS